MHSAIYHGSLSHARLQPRRHAFRYRLFMVYLDLAELGQVFQRRWLWSSSRPALARFERRDHLGDPGEPLDESVRRLVAAHTGERPEGPIRLLTHLRYFGYVFNPVCFYFCFDRTDRTLDAVVAEVNNTPWGERHCYVLRRSGTDPQQWSAHSAKALHVSPFMPMALDYEWGFRLDENGIQVSMALRPTPGAVDLAVREPPVFNAALTLRRRPMTATALAGVLLSFPFMTLKVIGAIHWQALLLWLKRVPVFRHPARVRDARLSIPPT